MKPPTKESAGLAPGGFPESVHQATPSVPHDAQAGKAVAVMLYNVGARSIGETRVAFSRHPEWRAA